MQGVKDNGGMILPKLRLCIVQQGMEHGAVFHVVAVDQIVVPALNVASVQKRNAADGTALVKGPAQIVFRLLGRIHHRITFVPSIFTQPKKSLFSSFSSLYGEREAVVS